MGLGVPDPKGVFGSTLGLQEKYGPARVLDMPTAENGMTGIALGSALAGMRPVMLHQRIDFALLAMEQIVNQAAKWNYMFGGVKSVPLLIRLIIGRGWGQGPQHSQSLQAWFAHVPGLKVVMPATPYDVKGLLIASIEDNNPVIFLEHRWLYNISGDVPEGHYTVPLSQARIAREGTDVTLVGISYMTLEALRAAEILADLGISAEVIDLRTISPLDSDAVQASVRKTGRLIVADTGSRSFGVPAEIITRVCESGTPQKCPPRRLATPDCPMPTSPALANAMYPRALDIVQAARESLGITAQIDLSYWETKTPLDQPDKSFTGPF
jgi:pyruvate dehydrogenase E1 component beta subunit